MEALRGEPAWIFWEHFGDAIFFCAVLPKASGMKYYTLLKTPTVEDQLCRKSSVTSVYPIKGSFTLVETYHVFECSPISTRHGFINGVLLIPAEQVRP